MVTVVIFKVAGSVLDNTERGEEKFLKIFEQFVFRLRGILSPAHLVCL
jgi:hypothetical protein